MIEDPDEDIVATMSSLKDDYGILTNGEGWYFEDTRVYYLEDQGRGFWRMLLWDTPCLDPREFYKKVVEAPIQYDGPECIEKMLKKASKEKLNEIREHIDRLLRSP